MTSFEIVRIRPDMDDALAGIVDLAAAAAMPESPAPEVRSKLSERGFLVSDYTLEKYRQASARGQLLAVLSAGRVVSFLLTYGPGDEVDPTDHGSIFIRQRVAPRAPIIKQITTDAAAAGRGYAKLLYKYFASAQHADIYAAIVKSPPNKGSEAFHRGLGFYEHTVFEHPDGKPRGIWRWTMGAQFERRREE